MRLMDQNTSILLARSSIRTNVYGVEIEFENYDNKWRWQKGDSRSGSAMWLLTKDDSLRNGCELVSQPLIQSQMRRALECVQNTFDHGSYTVSKRCSIHVHMNLLNLKWGEVWSVAMIYAFLEPEIFAFFGAERQENHFCVPLFHHTKLLGHFKRDATTLRLSAAYIQPPPKTKTKKVPNTTTVRSDPAGVWHVEQSPTMPLQTSAVEVGPHVQEYALDDDSLEVEVEEEETVAALRRPLGVTRAPTFRGGYTPMGAGGSQFVRNAIRARLSVPGKAKYCALSAWRMADLGTFEFRLLPATLDMDNVVLWVKFLGQIKHLAKQYPDPMMLQKDYEKRGRTWLWKIFGVGPPPATSSADREDADEAGFMIAGDPEINKDQMEWRLR